METCGNNYPIFKPGEKVVSLVNHPPEIESGTVATIVSPYVGTLYAVQLPDGALHRWFAWSELQSANPMPFNHQFLQVGDYATVISNEGHPKINDVGTVVKVVKTIQTPFYDLMLENGKYHRWLAEFEIISWEALHMHE